MTKIEKHRRNAIMRARRLINPTRRLDSVRVEGLKVTYRCITCGSHSITNYKSVFEAFKMFWWHKAGCTGKCKICTKAIRDRSYPLPSVES